jgi:hypothetical protein
MLPPTNTTDAMMLIRIMNAYYEQAMTQFQEDNDYYEGDLEGEMEVPEGFEVSIPTTARAIIDEAVDNIQPYDISIYYPPRGFGEKPQQDAETIQRFLKSVWTYWRQTNSDIDILRDFIKNMFKNGKAVFKVVPDWTLWPSLSDEEEAKLMDEGGKPAVAERARLIKDLRKQAFPIICRSMSPIHVKEDPTMDSRKLWCIEEYEISIDEIRNKYTQYYDYFLQMVRLNYTVRELWTATWIDWNGVVHDGWHWIFINETCVNGPENNGFKNGEPNPYHNVPYVIKHSGFGSETYDGKPEKKAVGFLTKQVKSQLKAEMRRITAFDALMQQLAFPIVMLPDTLEDLDFDLSPGGINYVPSELLDNAQNTFLSAKLPAPEYLQSISMIQNQIERGTTQRAVRGAGVPGTSSAAQLGMITSQAKLRLEPIKMATEEAVDMVNAMVLYYVENILKAPVSIFAAENLGDGNYILKPEMIKQKYRTRTTFMPNEDEIRERKLVLATDAMTKAKLNPYDALTFAGWENPMEVISRNLAYEIMQSPAVMRQLAKQALKDWGLDDRELELEELNDNSVLQQAQVALQQRLMGQTGAGQPGQPVTPQGGGGQQPQPSQAPPQAQGAPVNMAPQSPEAQGAAQMIANRGQ